MADSTPAPGQRNRLTKGSTDAGWAAEWAQALVTAEYALRHEPRDRGARSRAEPDRRDRQDGESTWRGLWRSAREMFSGSAGAGQSPFDTVSGLSETIHRMPREQREAVEDAVMHLLRTNKAYGDAYDTSPASMLHTARFANNAYERQAKGERGPGVEIAEALNAATEITRTDPEQDGQYQARWERSASTGGPAPAEVGARVGTVGGEPYSGMEFFAIAGGSSPASSGPGASLLGPEGVKAVHDTPPGSRSSRTPSDNPAGPNVPESSRKRRRMR
ncbi:hypothetical protein AB0M29_17990 [Streptomyces sp. NPDC051976]|uniref:hypothetical protein n=1 Tax=Streptomyces sp. NPDC051976 TaxID=3154947 RepID=UPI003445A56C